MAIEERVHVHRSLVVQEFTNGLLDPDAAMLGPVEDGGTIVANTAPGCWGPMITPRIRGGHEVTRPVAVDGAEVGDAVAIRIRDVTVTSVATASGHDVSPEGHFVGDPYVAARCPVCDVVNPETRVEGIGPNAVVCVTCGNPVTPFQFVHGYTVVFDEDRTLGVTVPDRVARRIAERAEHFAALPDASVQHSILTYAPSDMAGVIVRMRPFLGQLGTTPSIRMPDSHNAGDFGSFLVGAPHQDAITAEQLEEHRTDGHLDVNSVRAGAIVVAPVKVAGAGIYVGDMHANQGDGEIAGHTMDVAGSVTLQVEVLKGRTLAGPVVFPLVEDLPPTARPFTPDERARAEALARAWGVEALEDAAPISVIGTGSSFNEATDVGLARAASLLGLTVAEVRNRATITGAIEIGRLPGVARVTFLAPLSALDAAGLETWRADSTGSEAPSRRGRDPEAGARPDLPTGQELCSCSSARATCSSFAACVNAAAASSESEVLNSRPPRVFSSSTSVSIGVSFTSRNSAESPGASSLPRRSMKSLSIPMSNRRPTIAPMPRPARAPSNGPPRRKPISTPHRPPETTCVPFIADSSVWRILILPSSFLTTAASSMPIRGLRTFSCLRAAISCNTSPARSECLYENTTSSLMMGPFGFGGSGFATVPSASRYGTVARTDGRRAPARGRVPDPCARRQRHARYGATPRPLRHSSHASR